MIPAKRVVKLGPVLIDGTSNNRKTRRAKAARFAQAVRREARAAQRAQAEQPTTEKGDDECESQGS